MSRLLLASRPVCCMYYGAKEGEGREDSRAPPPFPQEDGGRRGGAERLVLGNAGARH